MDDGVAAMLRMLDAEFPAVEQMSGPQARAAVAARRLPVTNLDDVERTQDRVVDSGKGSRGSRGSRGSDGAIPVRIYWPHHDAQADGTGGAVVFCHGGGFVLCDIESHDGFCRAMSRYTRSLVVSVDYRLAPESAAPAAAQDAFAAFCWVIEHATDLGVDAGRVVIAGDSAGGNLAAVTAILCRERRVPMPCGQVLLYPVIDPSFDTASYRDRASGYFLTRAAMEWYWSQYLGRQPLPEPAYLVAPARADSHAGLPPAVVVTGTHDPLHSEGSAYARQLRSAGVPVVHRDFPGLFHGFLTMLPFPPAAAARELLWADIRKLLAAAPPATEPAP